MGLTRKAFSMKPLAAAIGGLLVQSSPLVFGQTPIDANSNVNTNQRQQSEIEEVIVTVQRREQNILDVPYNITSVSGDDIAKSFTRDNAELLRSIPGVSQIDQGPRNGAQFSSIRIRGLNVDSSANSDFAVASVATVSTYVNETPVYANLALIDLERVEVLRGPQATLYGSGALGGTVKYFLTEPMLGEVEAAVGTVLSNVDGSNSIGYATTGIINYPLGETLAVRANVYWQDYPGITDYTNLYQLDGNGVPVQTGGILDAGANSTAFRRENDVDTYESVYARVALSWLPTDKIELLATYLYQDDDVGGRREQTEGINGLGEPFGDYQQGAVILEPSEREFELVSLEAVVDFGFATLTSASSYYDNNGSSETDNTGFYANNFPAFYYNYPRPLYTAEREFLDEAFVQELRLVGSVNDQFDYVLGAFYRDNDRGFAQVSDLVGFEAWADAFFFGIGDFVSTDNVFTYRRDESYTEIAGFGELTWNATDKLRLTVGARYFEVDSDVDTFVRACAYDSCAGEVNTPFSVTEDDFLLKGNVAYDLGDEQLFYVTVSEGFRRGGNNAVPTIGTFANDEGWLVYDSDTVLNYEVGVKGIVNEVRYDLSAFYIDWSDPQFNTSTPAGFFFTVVNGDEARTQGIELQLSGSISERLGYAFGYAYVDAALSNDLVAPIDIGTGLPTPVALEGAPLPGVPEHAVNLAVDYFAPITAHIDLALRLDGFYQSKTQNVLDQGVLQAIEFDGFSIWDASAALLYKEWTAAVFVKNIFNEAGTTGAFTPEAFGPQPAAEFFGSNSRTFITLPLTLGVSLNYEF